MILSHYQVTPLLDAERFGGGLVRVSLDLGRRLVDLPLDEAGLHLNDRLILAWSEIETIAADENGVFQVLGAEGRARIEKIRRYSELTQRSYSLFPTTTAPTMLVSGITMHRIVGCDPWQDTRNKIAALGRPPTGRVLDTCTGLGYTAIQAVETAAHVDTIELDPAVLEICRLNPWSEGLFQTEHITCHSGHAWDVIEEMDNGCYQAIIHDPPMFNLAGELYAADFYRELARVLGKGGLLFHYIGNPSSRSGAGVTRGAIRRLKEVGFRRVSPRPQAFGVLAVK